MKGEDYQATLVRQLTEFRRRYFPNGDSLFVCRESGPPVFLADHADANVLTPPRATEDMARAVVNAMPAGKRQRFFGSMKSSQALAQSVFGNLKASGKWQVLQSLTGDDGESIFFPAPGAEVQALLEHEMDYLDKKAQAASRVDVFLLQGPYRTAVECKLAEPAFGRCSRPLPKPDDTRSDKSTGDSSYTSQQGRPFRCSLAGAGAGYWGHIPDLLAKLPTGDDQCPCPLNRTYQLVRTVMAACIRPDGSVDPAGGHAVLVYDARNPAFADSGEAGQVYNAVKAFLREPGLLQKTTWQAIASCLRCDGETSWLAEALAEKYGIV